MRIFKLNRVYSIACEFQDDKNGFSHVATLLKNGSSYDNETKVKYYNRTWESFEFETVLKRCIDDNFEGKEHEKFINIVKTLR